MATIKHFEDIVAWQKSVELCSNIYSLTNKGEFSKDFALQNQIRKSVISISSNIAEGFERESTNQFIYFLSMAKASAGETRSQLFIAKNLNYITADEFNDINKNCIELSKLISSFIIYLRASKKVNSN